MYKMKKIIFLFLILTLLAGCKKKAETNNSETGEISANETEITPQETESYEQTKNYQLTNPLLSTYQDGPYDGYSWRNREINYDTEDCTLSKEKLISTVWRMDVNKNQYALLVFYQDNIFRIGTRQAGVSIEGKYKIENNELILFDYNTDDPIGIEYTLKREETVCKLNFSSDNIMYKHELEIDGVKYFPYGSEKNTGDKAVIDEINVEVVDKPFVFNDTVKFRAKPSISSATIPVYLYNEISYGKISTDSFKKGTIVTVLAKIPKTETIGNDTGSWCYIKVEDGFEGNQYGWVFGAYFDEYDESKNEEYLQTMRKELNLNQDEFAENDEETDSEKTLQAEKILEIAGKLYMQSKLIEKNADHQTEKKGYYTIYYSHNNCTYSVVVEFVNNYYLEDSAIKIGMKKEDVIDILGTPIEQQDNQLKYDTFFITQGYGYNLALVFENNILTKIKCDLEK